MTAAFDPFAALRLARGVYERAPTAEQRRLEAVAAVQAREEQELQAAREDVNVFMRLVFKNDQDPNLPPFEQQDFHCEWQDLWEHHQLTVLHGATGFGKSEQMIGRQVWKLGRNPMRRLMIGGKQQENGSKLLLKMQRLIEDNPLVRRIFPSLIPGSPWTTDKLRLATAGVDITTNNVEVYGVEGSPQNVRADEIWLDDIIDDTNTRSEAERKKIITFVDSVVQSRLTTNGQLHITVNAWHREDVAHVYKERPGVTYRCYPAVRPNGEPLWPSFRPKAWLDMKKATMSAREFARMLLCQVGSDDVKLIDAEGITAAKMKGQGQKPLRAVVHALDRQGHLRDWEALDNLGALLRQEMRVIVALDLSTGEKSKKRKSDLTVFWVVGLMPSGQRVVLWAEAGRWTAPVILQKMKEYEERYRPNRFVVESNAAQVFLVQFAQFFDEFQAAIDSFVTSGQKWDESLGIEEIGVEMKAGRWVVPGPAAGQHVDQYLATLTPEEREAYATIQAGCQYLEDFSRVGHTPDHVMAWYLAKEGVKRALTGVFSHAKARTPEDEARAQAGAYGTARALGLATSPAAPAIPDHARHLLGM